MKISDFFRTIEPEERRVTAAEMTADSHAIRNRLRDEGPAIWWSRHEIAPGSGIFTDPGQFDFNAADFLNYSGIPPASLAGKRVLDLGAFAGAMTFGAEDFGAEVVAIDVISSSTCGFSVVHSIRGSSALHVTCSAYDLHPRLFGLFDVVFFSGLHYHLRHPILAMERINSVLKWTACFSPMARSVTIGLRLPKMD